MFRRTGHNETKNMVTVNYGKRATFQPVYDSKKILLPSLCKIFVFEAENYLEYLSQKFKKIAYFRLFLIFGSNISKLRPKQ